MNILVIGSNGREHALASSYAKSKKARKVIMVPGNGLTDFENNLPAGKAGKIKNYPDVGMMDFDKIVAVCKKEKIDLVDVAQDDVIAAGYVDKLEKLGITAFGPTQKASQLEWDKNWSRNFMVKYKLPIPQFESFTDQKKAIGYVNKLPDQLFFIKASGLALGKGVIRAENKQEAKQAIFAMNKFGKSGKTFLIEEGLIGEEFTLFVICDGENYIITKSSQDHKTIYNGDQGPNTGGIGCVCPTNAITQKLLREIETKIIKPTINGMKKEGRTYKGILYVGGILTNPPTGGGVKIIEFNSRWGDPEAEVILPGIKTDYLKIVEATIMKQLNNLTIKTDNKVRLSVAGCSRGYPGDYSAVKGKEIFGLNDVMKLPKVKVFGAGIKRKGKRFFANGGRIFHLVAEGKDIIEARKKAYAAISMIHIEGDNLHYRTDIGWREVERSSRV
ncbi:MAG: phosphoribosylamine--glycine ligase [Candidatus Levyibacteriota bacterium]